MSTLMQASRQWATRPADERFTSLLDMQRAMTFNRDHSTAVGISSKRLAFEPMGDHLATSTPDAKRDRA